MANLKLTLSDLYTQVSNFLGLTDLGTAPTGDDLTNCKNIVYRGYRKFLYPVNNKTGQYHEWSFLKPRHTLVTIADKWKYQLPADFSSILTDPTYGEDEGYHRLIKISPEEIENLRAAGVRNYAPYYYAIVPTEYGLETGEYDEIWLYPEPDGSYPLQFFYKSDPLKPENATDYLIGGVKSSEAIIESCLAAAETQEDGEIGIHTQLASRLIQDLIVIDTNTQSNIFLGNLYSGNTDFILERGERGKIDLNNIYPDE